MHLKLEGRGRRSGSCHHVHGFLDSVQLAISCPPCHILSETLPNTGNEDEGDSGNLCHLWKDSEKGERELCLLSARYLRGLGSETVCSDIRNHSEHPNCRGETQMKGSEKL